MQQAIFGLGSNVGDREANLRAAQAALARAFGPVKASSLYESVALLPAGAPPEWNMPYVNMAVLAEADCPPPELLAIAKRIERELGRRERGRWGPREIDIDILVYGDTVLDTPELVIPHPELLRRDFALRPLVEIAPELKLPDGRMARELLA